MCKALKNGILIKYERRIPMIDNLEKVTVITGHYGSGKTEFSVNLYEISVMLI